MDDHDLLIRIDERVSDAIKEIAEIKALLQANSKRVGHLEGQVKAVWFILGGGGLVGSLVAGLMALLGRRA